MEQTITPSTTKGILIALLLIIIALAVYFMNLDPEGASRYVSFGIFIIGIILSINIYGKQIDYNATFGNYFAHGFKIAALVTAIMIIYVVIFVNLFPDVREKAMEVARKRMEQKGNLPQETINQGLEITKKFFMVFIIAGTLIGYLIFGAIASLIGAGITKKNPRPLEIDH